MTDKSTYLKEALRKKMQEAQLSPHALEKQAGLKRSAVQNILYGKSKKPSGEILGAITKVLGCSINDLLMDQQPAEPTGTKLLPLTTEIKELDTVLYAKAVQAANDIFAQQNIAPSSQDALNYIHEIYQYALSSQKNEIDQNFALWLARRSLGLDV